MSTVNHEQRMILALVILALVTLAMASGCDNGDSRVAEVAETGAERQAVQNQEMARLNREVAEGTKRLVEGQAAADERDQARQQDLHEQFNQLEAERRQQADSRQRDSLLAPVLLTLGTLLVCSLPLLVCWQLLVRLSRETQETVMTQILVDEVLDPDVIASAVDDRLAKLAGPHASLPGDSGSLPARLPGELD